MLILSRKRNETIIIGNGIEITVCGVSGGKVRIGVEAPPHIRILRGELQRYEECPREFVVAVAQDPVLGD